jgi:chromosome segregation ATPase
MNAAQRRKERREAILIVRTIESETAVWETRARQAEIRLQDVTAERDELAERARNAEDDREVLRLSLRNSGRMLEEARREQSRLADVVDGLEHSLARVMEERDQARVSLDALGREEHDAAKLRSRLHERGKELMAAHQRIRDLQAQIPVPPVDLTECLSFRQVRK